MMELFQTMDKIVLTGVKGYGFHGVLPQERVDGQLFVVDVELGVVSVAKAAKTDDLADTVDYGAVAEAIVEIVEGEPVNLIERLAGLVAKRCLEFDHVRLARVTVHKPSAPIGVPFADVAVSVMRSR